MKGERNMKQIKRLILWSIVVVCILLVKEARAVKDSDTSSPKASFEEVSKIKGNLDSGKKIFNDNCAVCHGSEARHTPDSIGPTLRNPALLGLADDKFLYNTITLGREGTSMPSWSFLSKEQVADLIAYFDSFKGEGLSTKKVLELVNSGDTSIEYGEKLYNGNCAACHGLDGIGGIGPNLSNPELQSLADASFFVKVMKEGRVGTAMPSWNNLSNEDAAGIIKYIKSWQKGTISSVRMGSTRPVKVDDNGEGKEIFETVCARCHGSRDRQGARSAPAILSKGFLSQASDSFIREIIKYGRSQTQMRPNLKGMGGVVELSEAQIDSVAAYIRSFEINPIDLKGIATISGDLKSGEYLYNTNCLQCHGENGQGGNGPGIGRMGFLAQVSDGFIMGMARMGRAGSGMRAFTGEDGLSALSEKDLSDIVAFLRSDERFLTTVRSAKIRK